MMSHGMTTSTVFQQQSKALFNNKISFSPKEVLNKKHLIPASNNSFFLPTIRKRFYLIIKIDFIKKISFQ